MKICSSTLSSSPCSGGGAGLASCACLILSITRISGFSFAVLDRGLPILSVAARFLCIDISCWSDAFNETTSPDFSTLSLRCIALFRHVDNSTVLAFCAENQQLRQLRMRHSSGQRVRPPLPCFSYAPACRRVVRYDPRAGARRLTRAPMPHSSIDAWLCAPLLERQHQVQVVLSLRVVEALLLCAFQCAAMKELRRVQFPFEEQHVADAIQRFGIVGIGEERREEAAFRL